MDRGYLSLRLDVIVFGGLRLTVEIQRAASFKVHLAQHWAEDAFVEADVLVARSAQVDVAAAVVT